MAGIIPKEVKDEIATRWLAATEPTWKVALYTTTTPYTAKWSAYAATGEVAGTAPGYTTGGATLAGRVDNVVETNNWVLNADDTSWTGATFSAACAVVYYANGTTNPVRAIYDFGGTKTVSTGTFTIEWDSVGLIKIS